MSAAIRPPPVEVPTLTEVVGFSETSQVGMDSGAPPLNVVPLTVHEVDLPLYTADHATLSTVVGDALTGHWFPIDEDELAQRVLLDVQRQVDRMFEFRVRESVGPAFARLMEAFIEQTRDELAATLRDVVKRAVAQELARHRSR